MKELSVIIPFVNEFPQVIFTVQNIAQELRDRVDFEIVAVDNYCEEFKKQVGAQNDKIADQIIGEKDPEKVKELSKRWTSPDPDKGGLSIEACSRHNPWLKYVKYSDKLSHWNAKRYGVTKSSGKYLWFVDSHCIVSRDGLYDMFMYYRNNEQNLNGSIHLPLTYKILESRRLIYKLVAHMDKSEIAYSFTPLRIHDQPFEVPCMSCCGILISRDIYDEVGGWPQELGIYGGGENFMNYTLSVLGKRKWIYPMGTLFHHGEKRAYHYLYDDYIRNKILAAYLYGGHKFAHHFSQNTKGRPEVLEQLFQDVVAKCNGQRGHIKERQKRSIQDWVTEWKSKG